MPDPKKVSPDAALKAAMDILKHEPDYYAQINPRLKALAENYVAESLGGKPFRILEAVEFQQSLTTE